MRSRLALFSALLGVAILTAWCFASVLFRGEQFAFRDAGHYYYPLHQRVQGEWNAGRLPLWDVSDNGGMPLLGNPTAAVLYPGKLVFALLPYPWAARIYLVGHVLFACASMTVLMRRWGCSGTAAAIAGMSYAFGGPVLFQYSNAIYLVGASWMPLGILAADAVVRDGSRRSVAGLALVLVMQCLGGDIQSAYMLGMISAALAVAMSFSRKTDGPVFGRRIVWGIAAWVVATLAVACLTPSVQGAVAEANESVRRGIALGIVGLKWLVLAGGVGWLVVRLDRSGRTGLARRWGLLLAAAGVAALVGSAQLVPVGEYASRSFRTSDSTEGGMDIYLFSLEPYRLAEAVFPGILGNEFPENRYWLKILPPRLNHGIWTPSLYLGGITAILAIAALGGMTGERRSRRNFLAITTLFGVLVSLGRFGGPLWLVRFLPEAAPFLGPHNTSNQVNAGSWLPDEVGSPYWMLATLAPGFSSFRYPGKFLPLAALGFSGLAAIGWDRVASGNGRKAIRTALAIAAVGAVALGLTVGFRKVILEGLAREAKVPSLTGLIDPGATLFEIRRSLGHGLAVAAAAAGLAGLARRGDRWAGPVAVVLLAIDLAAANARIVLTVPQSVFDEEPAAARLIRESEKRDPSPGPFRIHRPPIWRPISWLSETNPDRVAEFVGWERETLQPNYGPPLGFSYVVTPGVLEPIEYLQIFQPWTIRANAETASMLQIRTDAPFRYYPRRAFDIWGARYFILPVAYDDWLDQNRGIASFFTNAEILWPRGEEFRNPDRSRNWSRTKDWQLLRNPLAFPRSWVVHAARVRPTLASSDTAKLQAWLREINYRGDPFWNIEGRAVFDPRILAWVEIDPGNPLDINLPDSPVASEPDPDEAVSVERYESTRVELVARLKTPGLVVLSDLYYPGWTLKVDGQPAPMLRANRMMRAARVDAGEHRLVFTYEPRLVPVGFALSGVGLIAVVGLVVPIRRGRDVKGEAA